MADRRLTRPSSADGCRAPLRAAADDRARSGLGPGLHDRLRDRRHHRFRRPKKLAGYTGLCPAVDQSGGHDRRGPLAKNGPKYLRWALIEAAIHAARHPVYEERYQRTKRRLGRQRGAKVARVDIARKLAEAIWHMLTKNKPFAPAGPAPPLWPLDGPS